MTPTRNFGACALLVCCALAAFFGCFGSGACNTADHVTHDPDRADGLGADILRQDDVEPMSDRRGDIPGDIPVSTPVSGEFTLLTYNVAGLPDGISKSDPEQYMPMISPLLNGYDLAVVQEDFVYHQELAAAAGHPYRSLPLFVDPDEVPLGDGLNRFSLFPIGRVYRLQWPGCSGEFDCASDCLATKGFSMARVELHTGISIDLYNLHGEAGGCPADLELRAFGFKRLVEFIRTFSAGRPVIVAGDFNLRWNDPEDVDVLQMLLDEGGLTESCLALECGDERIDKVFFASSDSLQFEALTWAVPTEFVSPDGEDLSDHKPVSVRFAWSGIPAASGNSGLDDEIYPGEVSVVTLNLLHGLADEDPDAQPFDRLAERLDLVQEDLLSSRDALVALQEISLMKPEGYPDVMGALLSVLDRATCPACHAMFGPVGGIAPIFDSGEAVGQATLTRLPQSGPAHNRQVNLFRTVSHLRVDSSLGKVDLYNVHVDGSGDPVHGLAEAEAILAFVDETSRPDHVVILAGDFNSTPDSAALALFGNAGFVDLGEASGLVCTQADNSGCTVDTLPLAQEGNRTSKRIDYLLMRAGADVVFECAPRFGEAVAVDGGVLWVSDHIGLGCRLSGVPRG